jgi:hypothetical protein
MPSTVPVMFANDEERRLDDETEVTMLKWRSVPFPHQEPNETCVAFRHLVRRLIERDTCAVHHSKVRGQRTVQRNEPVVEDGVRVLG